MTIDDERASSLIAPRVSNSQHSAEGSTQQEMAARPCPVCGSADESHVYCDAHFDLTRLDEFAFASRKLPEYMHYRLIACPVCDLIYASPAPGLEALALAYRDAGFDSAEEAPTRAGPTPGTSPRSSAACRIKMERSTSAREMGRSSASYSPPASPASLASSHPRHRYPPPRAMSGS